MNTSSSGRSGRFAIVFSRLTLAGSFFIWSPPAAAGATLTLQPVSSPPTGTVSVTGTGFGALEQVLITFDRATLVQLTADSAGGFTSVPVVIPAAALPGMHRIEARSSPGKQRARAALTVRTDWASYRWDSLHAGSNPYENVLSPANVSQLTQLWAVTVGAEVASSPAVVGGVVYIGAVDGTFYALDAGSGTLKWSFPTGESGGIRSSPSVADGRVYITSGNSAYAFDAATGAVLWSTSTGGRSRRNPARFR